MSFVASLDNFKINAESQLENPKHMYSFFSEGDVRDSQLLGKNLKV